MIKTDIIDGLEVYSCLPTRKTKRPPLLFIHGAFAGGWMWTDTFMPALARAKRLRLIQVFMTVPFNEAC